jgi:hypothetical protein
MHNPPNQHQTHRLAVGVMQKAAAFSTLHRGPIRENFAMQVMLPVWLVFSVTRLFFAVNPFNAHGI